MTTVVYRNGVLAADTRACYGGSFESGAVRKVLRSSDGRLIGMCGDAAVVETYATKLADKKCKLPIEPGIAKDGGRVIEILPNGKIWIHEFGGRYCIGSPEFGAWGSGSDAARGALHMGADAALAVKVASKVDKCTGPRVASVRFRSEVPRS